MTTTPKSSNQCNEADPQALGKQNPATTCPVSELQSPVSSVGTQSPSSCYVASSGIDGRTTLGPIEQFRSQIRAAGLTPPDVIEADGKLHRFASNGKRGDDAGWYVLYLDAIPAGCFGDWRGGSTQTWRTDIGRTPTSAEEDQYRARMAAIRREREAEVLAPM
jgi:putative DNA primase/helicase